MILKDEIRFVTPDDAASLAEIYRPYVEKTSITAEYTPPSADEFRSRIAKITSMYPYLVYLREGIIVAYAYANRQQERAAYQWNVDCSVYVAEKFRSQGIGRKLYSVLFPLLVEQHIQNLYAVISLPNEPSVRLHKEFGFVPVGIFHQTMYKFGQWFDTIHMEKQLGGHEKTPNPVLPASIHLR